MTMDVESVRRDIAAAQLRAIDDVMAVMGGRLPVIQGDVMLYPVDAMPDDAVMAEGDTHVLALGERTGHTHVLDRSRLGVADGTRYVDVGEGAALRHADHGTVPAPAGVYRVIQQSEPDIMGGFRAVAD